MTRQIIRTIFLIGNLLAAIWLLLCTYAAFHDPSDAPSLFSLFSFSLAFALVGNIALAICCIFFFKKKRKWYALISALALIISWPVSKSVIGFNPAGNSPSETIQQGSKKIKITTYNVHLFDLGGWTKDNSTQKKIVDFIREESPDILCLQEFYMDIKDPKQPFTEVIANLGYPYFEFTKKSEYTKSRITSSAAPNEKLAVGIAVFSKYPLSQKKDLTLPGSDSYKAMLTDVQVNEDLVMKLLVTHLQSFRLGNEEINFIEKVKDNLELSTQKEQETKSLLKKLMQASHIRAQQANFIADILRGNKRNPMVLVGDFNDIPGSYVYQTLSSELRDPFLSKGFGFGRTFNAISPTLRIDHIFYNPSFMKPLSYEIAQQTMSDHYPLMVEFILTK